MAVSIILLAAGYATRLYPLTKDRPKALLPLGQGVMLDEVIRSVKEIPDVRHQVLVTNHRFAGQFKAWQRARGVPIQIVDDGTDAADRRLGAIRDLELARTRMGAPDDLVVVGTDNLFTWSLADFVARAQRHRTDPTIALWQAESPAAATQFGVVIRDADSRITAFVEKSPQPPSAEVALCVYYFPSTIGSQIAAFLASGGNADAPGYFIEWLVRTGTVYGALMPGAWYDIGTLATYEQVVQAWPR